MTTTVFQKERDPDRLLPVACKIAWEANDIDDVLLLFLFGPVLHEVFSKHAIRQLKDPL
ncbi:hypothetical protein RGU77_09275 [Actimicrobium sp. CCI2.3]|uniref:hypothetical protein n=1 Tax=Actimicrobium sp. CCI2.3 TaxID=3048616 RepID=UPI002AB5660A|nr:hypothetical protein [Actimicrobium sp. CCI2.3]MDY7574474.1 hypothetical protein [Actimicrobium sp. CCI2.3]